MDVLLREKERKREKYFYCIALFLNAFHTLYSSASSFNVQLWPGREGTRGINTPTAPSVCLLIFSWCPPFTESPKLGFKGIN